MQSKYYNTVNSFVGFRLVLSGVARFRRYNALPIYHLSPIQYRYNEKNRYIKCRYDTDTDTDISISAIFLIYRPTSVTAMHKLNALCHGRN